MPLNLPSVPLRCHLHGWSQRLSLSLPAATLLPPPPPHSPSSSHSDPPSLSSAVTSDRLPVLVSHLPPPLCASTAFPPQLPQPGAALSLTTTHGHPTLESDTAQARLTEQGLTPVSLVSQLFPARFPPAGADAAERCPLALPGSMPSARGQRDQGAPPEAAEGDWPFCPPGWATRFPESRRGTRIQQHGRACGCSRACRMREPLGHRAGEALTALHITRSQSGR